VSPHKRVLLFFALTAVVFLASTRTTDAQGFRGRGPVVVVGGFYASPYYLYDPGYGGFEGQWGYPMYPPPYRYRMGAPDASVRIEVKPKEAGVFVDGYYAGIVDDYDGVFQRLHVAPGEHEIELYLDGYRTVRQKVYLPVNDTFKIRYTMERLGPNEQPEPRPQPINPPMPPQAFGPGMPQPPMPQGPVGRGPAVRRMPPPPPQQQPPPDNARGAQPSAYGTLTVRVQPGDAEVSIDGEQWRGPDGRDRLVVDVAEGSHTVEIRKSGYRTYVTQVEIRRGETTPLNVSLRSQEQQ
jgi:PEGA domain